MCVGVAKSAIVSRPASTTTPNRTSKNDNTSCTANESKGQSTPSWVDGATPAMPRKSDKNLQISLTGSTKGNEGPEPAGAPWGTSRRKRLASAENIGIP